MLTHTIIRRCRECGTSLIEVLITIVILAFGLLGLAGMQSKLHLTSSESYQRAQAIVLLNDLGERISANRAQAASYVTASPLGTGDSEPADCTTVAAGPLRDRCEVSNALKGTAEKKSSTNAGAMTDARACVTQIQPADTVACTHGIYQVTVVWQGLHKTRAPQETDCGQGLYGDETYRRAISLRVTIGTPTCAAS